MRMPIKLCSGKTSRALFMPNCADPGTQYAAKPGEHNDQVCGKLLVISRSVAAKIKQQNGLRVLSLRETRLKICQASEVIYLSS
jgi:hypothetical protein